LVGFRGVDIRNLRVLCADDTGSQNEQNDNTRTASSSDDDVLLSVARVECAVTAIRWRARKVVLSVAVERPALRVRAYDAAFVDTNWRRLGKRLRSELRAITKKDATAFPVDWAVSEVAWRGDAEIALVPPATLGGRDLAARLVLDLDRDLAPLTRLVTQAAEAAEDGCITFAEAYDIVARDVAARLRAALRDVVARLRAQSRDVVQKPLESAHHAGRELLSSLSTAVAARVTTASLGDAVVNGLGDLRGALEGAVAKRVDSLTAETWWSRALVDTAKDALADLGGALLSSTSPLVSPEASLADLFSALRDELETSVQSRRPLRPLRRPRSTASSPGTTTPPSGISGSYEGGAATEEEEEESPHAAQ